MTREQVLERCVAAEVPAGAINTVEDMFNDPQYAARENLLKVMEPLVGELTVPGIIPKMSGTPGKLRGLGPAFKSANDKVYRGLLGLTPGEMAALEEKGVI